MSEIDELHDKIRAALLDAFDERDFKRLFDGVMGSGTFDQVIAHNAFEDQIEDALDELSHHGRVHVLVRAAKVARPSKRAISALPSDEHIAETFDEIFEADTRPVAAQPPANFDVSLAPRPTSEAAGDQIANPPQADSRQDVYRRIQAAPRSLRIDAPDEPATASSSAQPPPAPKTRIAALYSTIALRRLGSQLEVVFQQHCQWLESFGAGMQPPETLDLYVLQIEQLVSTIDESPDPTKDFAEVVLLAASGMRLAEAESDHAHTVEIAQAALPVYELFAARVRDGGLTFQSGQIADLVDQFKIYWEMRIELAEFESGSARRASAKVSSQN